jgi:hypothetical protein
VGENLGTVYPYNGADGSSNVFYAILTDNGNYVAFFNSSGEYVGYPSDPTMGTQNNICYYTSSDCSGTCMIPSGSADPALLYSIVYNGSGYYTIQGDETATGSITPGSNRVVAPSAGTCESGVTNSNVVGATTYVTPTHAYTWPTGVTLPLTSVYITD